MKVALIHDYIKEYGGAERVLETLHEIWPESTVFTTVYLPEYLGPHKSRFKNWEIHTSWLQNIPFVEKLISPARLITPWIFESWDFTNFDVVIVSATGAYFPNLIIRKPETLHICYCHTPPRYLYGYPTARNWQKHFWGRIVGEFFNHGLRQIDFVAAQRPDYFIANSEETKKRIDKFYRRESKIIYPPVEVRSKIQIKNENEQHYYLAGGRLARAKHIDLAIGTCNKLKLPLKVFGKSFADYGDELKNIAGQTIEFLGEVKEEELANLYTGARALIYPSEAEDFGIIPVEAMSLGVPVIAYNEGGVKETVIDGKTGVLFNKLDVDDIAVAIKKLDKLKIKSTDCVNQARKFSKERFIIEMKNFISSKIKVQK